MFSVTNTGMCCLPLCTAIVRPMKSGRIVERRDQVLIGRLSLLVRAASTLLSRCASMNGPFLIERVIFYPLTLVTTLHDHAVGALVRTRPIALARRTPRAHRLARFTSTTLTTTMRVIDRVHRHTANGRANAAPTIRTGLADLAQAMLFVTDFADGGAALDVHAADLARAQTKLGVRTFASEQLHRSTGSTRDLGTLAGDHLDAMDRRTDRDVADRQGIARLDRGFYAADQLLTDFNTTRGDDVAALAMRVAQQGKVSGTVGVVLETLDLGRNAVLVTTEVHQTVVLLVTTALVTHRDATVVVTTGLLALLLDQRSNGATLVQIGSHHLDLGATAGRRRLKFYDCHDLSLPNRK